MPLVTSASSVDQYLVYLDGEPFVPLLLASYLVPRATTATRQRFALSIVGPSTWNELPLEIRLLPKNNDSAMCRLLKTALYRRGWAGGLL